MGAEIVWRGCADNDMPTQELAGSMNRARPIKSSPVSSIERCRSAEAAIADRCAASTATGAAGATAASTTASATTATAAATATAAPCHLLSAGSAVLLVEQMERGETDVGDFFFTEQDALGRREIQFLRCVRTRQSRCRGASSERECQSGSAQCRDCGFGHTLPLRSLLHWHSRILQPVRHVFRFQPERSYAQGERRARPSISLTR
jgi:hypothetical protein